METAYKHLKHYDEPVTQIFMHMNVQIYFIHRYNKDISVLVNNTFKNLHYRGIPLI